MDSGAAAQEVVAVAAVELVVAVAAIDLIVFGAGVGVGLLLAGSFRTRGGNRRFVRPVMNALTEIAAEIF